MPSFYLRRHTDDGKSKRKRTVAIVVGMRVVLRADVFHLQDVPAFWAALDGAVARHLLVYQFAPFFQRVGRWIYRKPNGNVRVGRVAGAASVLLVAEGPHDDRVVEGSCIRP